MSVTPESSPTSSRTDISQCPQVIPVTWYSFVVVMVVLLSICIPLWGIFPGLRLYPLPVSRKLCGCECRASARRLHSPHGFLGGPRFGRGLTGGSDMAQPRSGNECGEGGDDGGDHAGGVQPAGERRLRCCSQRRAHRIRQLRVRREDHADGSDGDVHADAVGAYPRSVDTGVVYAASASLSE